jgi:hypothetical protein
MFRDATLSATSLHKERRMTAAARARVIADAIAADPDEAWTIWCDTDYEGDELRKVIPDAVEVHGSDSADDKAARLLGFARGDFKRLITKPKIAGFGMNWQHCARVAMVGVSYEWESFYQRIRRSWRFGQTRPVKVLCAVAQTEGKVWSALETKAASNDTLRSSMIEASRKACRQREAQQKYTPLHRAAVPAWIRSLRPSVKVTVPTSSNRTSGPSLNPRGMGADTHAVRDGGRRPAHPSRRGRCHRQGRHQENRGDGLEHASRCHRAGSTARPPGPRRCGCRYRPVRSGESPPSL